MAAKHILAIDQGTTSTRAIVFDATGRPVASAQKELPQIFPKPGWVEHDAEEIWRATVEVGRGALAKAKLDAKALAGIGITNQRETTVVWDRSTGKPIHNAVVWQDRARRPLRGAEAAGHEGEVTAKTGLILDPYFSGTKIAWILDHVAVAAPRRQGRAGGRHHRMFPAVAPDRRQGACERRHQRQPQPAARHPQRHLGRRPLEAARRAGAALPKVVDCSGELGVTTADFLGAPVPVLGMAGDQQGLPWARPASSRAWSRRPTARAALHFQHRQHGRAFAHRLLTTIAYQLGGRRTYALEGSIFIAGAAVQWLRDGLHLIAKSSDVEQVAAHAKPDHGVYMVPAFVGLGAPYWDAGARGALLGLTRDSGPAEIAAATLDSVCFQTRDRVEAMRGDGAQIDELRVDGGMVVNDPLMQRLADTVAVPSSGPR